MKSIAKRGLALAAAAASCCALGLLAPTTASAAIADPAASHASPPAPAAPTSTFALASVAFSGTVLTAERDDAAFLAPPRSNDPRQIWRDVRTDHGIDLVNYGTGQCLMHSPTGEEGGVWTADCGHDVAEQSWSRYDADQGIVLYNAGTLRGCLSGDRTFGAFTGDCFRDTARWRLIPAS